MDHTFCGSLVECPTNFLQNRLGLAPIAGIKRLSELLDLGPESRARAPVADFSPLVLPIPLDLALNVCHAR